MIGIIAFVLITNMSNLFTLDSAVPSSNKLFVYCNMTIESSVASILSLVIIRTYLPFILMLTLNIIVFIRLRRSKLRVTSHNTSSHSNQANTSVTTHLSHTRLIPHLTNKQTKFIVSTLFIDLTFVVFYTPLTAYFSISISSIINMNANWDPLNTAYIELFSNITQLFAYAYSVSLFFIFVLLNRYFRQEFIDFFRFQRILSIFSNNNSNRNYAITKSSN